MSGVSLNLFMLAIPSSSVIPLSLQMLSSSVSICQIVDNKLEMCTDIGQYFGPTFKIFLIRICNVPHSIII